MPIQVFAQERRKAAECVRHTLFLGHATEESSSLRDSHTMGFYAQGREAAGDVSV